MHLGAYYNHHNHCYLLVISGIEHFWGVSQNTHCSGACVGLILVVLTKESWDLRKYHLEFSWARYIYHSQDRMLLKPRNFSKQDWFLPFRDLRVKFLWLQSPCYLQVLLYLYHANQELNPSMSHPTPFLSPLFPPPIRTKHLCTLFLPLQSSIVKTVSPPSEEFGLTN